MVEFNFASLILTFVLVFIVALALRSVIRQRKKGGCGCGCSSCSGSFPHCIEPDKIKEETK
ncbi:MAG: FeoB-associated Cys-rich membrane protein [Oscillospiraceae bacterium]|nr:FeoB-associated Cys-rich membrane protein [Oscillospiraceae bacterium]